MKLLLATVALATVIAAPAFAQGGSHKAKAAHSQNLRGAQASQYGRTETRAAHSSNPANDVYDAGGHYLGSDPDTRIRAEIARDLYMAE
jgi:hypothetical protein